MKTRCSIYVMALLLSGCATTTNNKSVKNIQTPLSANDVIKNATAD